MRSEKSARIIKCSENGRYKSTKYFIFLSHISTEMNQPERNLFVAVCAFLSVWPQTTPSARPSTSTGVRLPEREVHTEIGINWSLDQNIPSHPKGVYIRILAESLLWEKRLGKTVIRTTEGLTTCMEPHIGWTIASSSWIFLQKRWLDREQELITVIQEETKRTEERKKLGVDHQHGQYHENCKRSTKPRDLKARR